MGTQNSLATKELVDKKVEYDYNGEKLMLSPSVIRNYLVNGGGNVSDQEVVMFLNLCRFQHLNPFLREVYLIKYGNSPASVVMGKEALTKRAMKNPRFTGQQAGVVIQKKDDTLEYRVGTLILAGEELVGGWAKVFVNGYTTPVESSVSFNEYVGTKADGSVNSQWAKKPATMIRKVALVQALREAFPDDLQGLYSPEEMDIDESILSTTPITPTVDVPVERQTVVVIDEDPLK